VAAPCGSPAVPHLRPYYGVLRLFQIHPCSAVNGPRSHTLHNFRVSIQVTWPVRFFDLVVHVLGPEAPVAAAAVPETNEAHFLNTPRQGRIEQPEIAAFERIHSGG